MASSTFQFALKALHLGDSLTAEEIEKVNERGMIASWCSYPSLHGETSCSNLQQWIFKDCFLLCCCLIHKVTAPMWEKLHLPSHPSHTTGTGKLELEWRKMGMTVLNKSLKNVAIAKKLHINPTDHHHHQPSQRLFPATWLPSTLALIHLSFF